MGGVTDAVLDTSETLLAGLDPEQREVALATRGAVCVLAGAGTGKTRAITHRIAYAAAVGTMNPAHVLALTFTVRAAGELRGRLRQLSAAGSGGPGSGGSGSGSPGSGGLGTGLVRASTFHAAALRQLNYFWPRVVGGRPPQLVDSKVSLVREAAKRAGLRLDGGTGLGGGGALADAAAEIEWAKVSQVRPDDYPRAAAAAGRSPAAGVDHLASVYAAYEELRRERHLIDFESVLELTAAILIDDRAAADQVRDTFRHFVVDEYQDVNPLQKLLLDTWLGDRDDLCVVGDPHQVIYSFTGATPSYLTGFTAEFPGATVVRLVRDYRSTPQVVAVANQLAPSAAPLVAQRPPGPRPVLTEYPDDTSEAVGLAVQVQALMAAAVPIREIAVLVRVNADTERFELALAEAGVPYVVRGAERFYERPVVRQALVLLRGAARGEAASAAVPGSGDSLPSSVRHVLIGIGLTPKNPKNPKDPKDPEDPEDGRAFRGSSGSRSWRGGPRALGVAQRDRPARGRHARRAAGGDAGRLLGRADPAGRARARAGRRRRDARVHARGQGSRVGRGAAARPGRGAHAHRARPDGRRDRGGKAATVCGGDQGARAPVPVLVAGQDTRGLLGSDPWCVAAAIAFPRRNPPRPLTL